MPNIGLPELVIILVIALLVIGPGKLPDVASSLGKSIREFRKAATDVQESVKLDTPIAPVVPAPAAPAPAPAAPAPNALATAATPNELRAPAAPDPAATAADGPTEARV